MDKLKFYGVLPNDRNNLNDLPVISQKYKSGSGLCNQLYNIVHGIIEAEQSESDFCIIDSFLPCIYRDEICSIDKIIDLKKTSNELNKLPGFENIKLIDRINCKFEILNAEYGFRSVNSINVLSEIKQYCTSDGIKIRSNTPLNLLFGDPCSGLVKKLYIQFKLGDNIVNIVEKENNNNINFSINNIQEKAFERRYYNIRMSNHYNEQLFNKLLKCIHYNPVLYEIADTIAINLKLDNPYIIHLRVEDDIIKMHHRHNSDKSEELIKNHLYNSYSDIIKRFIDPKENLHILTYDTDAISKIIGPEYNFTFTDNTYKTKLLIEKLGIYGRELSALIDLIIGIKYGSGFLGMYDINKCCGSTFSYVLAKYINKNTILIDIHIDKLDYIVQQYK